jgi:hypothetical protein
MQCRRWSSGIKAVRICRWMPPIFSVNDGGSMFRNVCIHLQIHTALLPGRPTSISSHFTALEPHISNVVLFVPLLHIMCRLVPSCQVRLVRRPDSTSKSSPSPPPGATVQWTPYHCTHCEIARSSKTQCNVRSK